MLAFAAFVPHPLISIPAIGKEHTSRIQQTCSAFDRLSQELYAAKPDIILVFSPHAPHVSASYSINQRPELAISFRLFGDLSDPVAIKNDIAFGYRIKESVESTIPIILTDEMALDYGSAVPLFHLTNHLDKNIVRIVPVGMSDRTLQEDFHFGDRINRVINRTTRRVAVLASGDLAHVAQQGSSGTNDVLRAHEFNKRFEAALADRDAQRLLTLDRSIGAVSQCAAAPVAALLGVLNERAYEIHLVSTEEFLGARYVSALVQLN